MSSPKTRSETQEEEHRGALMAIWAGLVVAALLLVWWLLYAAESDAPDPGQAEPPAAATRAETPSEGERQ
ncbi:hypothetical protein [Salipiger mangrovisoli]|uniref:Uncharacterized protein n=1 Tax=Salipiger mangrovisoli TaxID=2865933 RepID=A0ABR9X4A3_9RHOB|nr:hypothetical protein [Salipiger mangrovisoli]MBE9638389.1 hypothetical protein [Salipiger mangrovisoli]